MSTLELRGITKRFPGVVANDDISLSIAPGEVHALIGENGAGKSTLMSILYGMTPPDEGTILIGGAEHRFSSPREAIDAGLGMVFQKFTLFDDLTVAENIVYGAEPARAGVLDRRAAVREVEELSERFGLPVPVRSRVGGLPVGVLQRVEILKALYRNATTLILDEPTSVLTPQEGQALFAVMRTLAASGRSIVFISHKLDEVLAVADTITVLRDGRVVAQLDPKATTPREISQHMTGRDVELRTRLARAEPGDPVLEVSSLTVAGEGRAAVDDISMTVRSGEIVGVAGVAGNGQDALASAIAGHLAATGTIRIGGRDVSQAANAQRRAAGLTHIPEDRHVSGSAPEGDAVLNLAAGYHRSAPLRVRGLLRPQAMRAHAQRLIARFGVKIASPKVRVGTLSGGNLQKIVVARELGHDAPLLIAEQPTRGVDIGAIDAIHAEIDEYRARGGAVLLISSELSEIRNLSDRILVMFEGRIMAELRSDEADDALIGLLMAGVDLADARSGAEAPTFAEEVDTSAIAVDDEEAPA